MNRQMAGRLMTLMAGVITGIFVTLLVMPVHLNGEWILADRVAYGGGTEPQAGDRVIIESAVFTEDGSGGRLARRVRIENGRLNVNGQDVMDQWPGWTEFPEDMTTVIVEDDHLFVLSDDGSDGLDSRSEVMGQVKVTEVWGRVLYARKESGHGTEKAPGEQ